MNIGVPRAPVEDCTPRLIQWFGRSGARWAWLLIGLLGLPDAGYATVIAWIAAGWNPALLALTVLIAAWHAWLGVQVVIEDYVHGFLPKTIALLLSVFVHVLLAASGVYAVLRIALRSGA